MVNKANESELRKEYKNALLEIKHFYLEQCNDKSLIEIFNDLWKDELIDKLETTKLKKEKLDYLKYNFYLLNDELDFEFPVDLLSRLVETEKTLNQSFVI